MFRLGCTSALRASEHLPHPVFPPVDSVKLVPVFPAFSGIPDEYVRDDFALLDPAYAFSATHALLVCHVISRPE